MQKIIKVMIVGACALSSVAWADATSMPVDANQAIATFGKDLQSIRAGLDKGTMQPNQAMVLLGAIQARQNQVIIAQNAQIIQLLQAQQNPGASK